MKRIELKWNGMKEDERSKKKKEWCFGDKITVNHVNKKMLPQHKKLKVKYKILNSRSDSERI